MERLLAINYVVLATERCDYMPFLNLCISIKNKINKKGFRCRTCMQKEMILEVCLFAESSRANVTFERP